MAAPVLAVGQEDAGGPDEQMVGVGAGVGDGEVVEDDPAVLGEAVELAGGASLAAGAALPVAGVLGDPEPQPPADQPSGDEPGPARQRAGDLADGQRCDEAGEGDAGQPQGGSGGVGWRMVHGDLPAVERWLADGAFGAALRQG